MAKNPITILKEAEVGLDKNISQFERLNALAEKFTGLASQASQNIRGMKLDSGGQSNSLKQMNQVFTTRNNATQLYTAYLKELTKVEKALISQTNKNVLAQKGITDALIAQKAEYQVLNQRAKESAIISNKLGGAYKALSTELLVMKRKYKDMAVSEGVASKGAKTLHKDITQLDARLKRVDASVGDFRRNVGNYGKAMQSAGRAARQFAGALGFVGGIATFVAVLRDASKTVREFDRQVIAVQKTTNLSDKEMTKFKDSVIKLGIELKGVSIQGLVNASEVAGQMGIKGVENILKFSKTIEQLKLTSDIVGEEAVRNFAKFIEISDDTVEGAERLGSVITELGNNFATTEREILASAIEIQKGIALYDTSAESVLGLAAATSALGSAPEQARSGFQKVFKVLNDAAATGKDLTKILSITGQSAEEFRRQFEDNSVKSFQAFIKGLKESEEAGVNLAISLDMLGLNEKRTSAVVGALTKNYVVLEDALMRSANEYENNIALTEEAERASQSLNVRIEDLSDAYDGLILTLENGSGSIANFFKGSIGFIEKFLINATLSERAWDKVSKAIPDANRFFKASRQLQGLQIDFEKFLDTANEKSNIELSAELDRLNGLMEVNQGLSKDGEKLYDQQINAIADIVEERGKERLALENTAAGLGLVDAQGKIAVDQMDYIAQSIKEYTNEELAEYIKAKEAEGKVVDEVNEEGKRTIPVLNELIKVQKDELNTLDVLNEADILRGAIIRGNIEALEKEIELIMGMNKVRSNTIAILKGSEAALKKAISDIEELQEKQARGSKEWENYERKIRAAKRELAEFEEMVNAVKISLDGLDLSGFDTGDFKTAVDDINKEFDRILSGKDKLIEGLAMPDLDKIKSSVDQQLEWIRDAEKLKREAMELTAEYQEASIYQALELTNTFFDAKIQRYEDDIIRNNEYYEGLLANEELTDEQRDALEANRLRKEKEIEKKKQAELRKQAIFNKIAGLAEVAINTAIAVSKVTAQMGAAAPLLIPSIIALGALQAATIAATPIPKYKHGRKDGKEELAYVGDGGRKEVVVSKEYAYITPDRPTLAHLKRGDRVYPSVKSFAESEDAKKYSDKVASGKIYKELQRYSIMKSLAVQSDSLRASQKRNNTREVAVIKGLQSLEHTLRGKKTQFRLNQNINIGDDLKFLARLKDAL